MNPLNLDSYRLNWFLFKALIGLNVLLFKLLLVWIHVSFALS